MDDAEKESVFRRPASYEKTLRTVLLAVLLQVSWPDSLTSKEITARLPFYGEGPRVRALDRDIETLTDSQLKDLPGPDDPELEHWCADQQRRMLLAISYDRRDGTFRLVQPAFFIEIDEREARAFVALQEGFTPGTPYAEAIQLLLKRWAWLFSEKSRQLVAQKRKRKARPLLLPLSPAEDYSQHGETILLLDRALEESMYIAFAYTPLGQSLDDRPIYHTRAEPYELEYREGHWYFTAFLSEQGAYVDYRVDRIRPGSLTLDTSHEKFSPGTRTRTGVKIRYWVSPMMARHKSLSARLREQQLTLLDDGQGAIVEGYAKSIWWAKRLLLGYGSQVKALAPDKLVEEMSQEVAMMGKLY